MASTLNELKLRSIKVGAHVAFDLEQYRKDHTFGSTPETCKISTDFWTVIKTADASTVQAKIAKARKKADAAIDEWWAKKAKRGFNQGADF